MANNEIIPLGEEPPNPYKTNVASSNKPNSAKPYSSVVRCVGCNESFKLLELLPSNAGDLWRKCPRCSMNFQVG